MRRQAADGSQGLNCMIQDAPSVGSEGEQQLVKQQMISCNNRVRESVYVSESVVCYHHTHNHYFTHSLVLFRADCVISPNDLSDHSPLLLLLYHILVPLLSL